MKRHMAAVLFLITMTILTGCGGKAKETYPEGAEALAGTEQDVPSENAGAGDTSRAEDEIYPAYEPRVTYPPQESAGRDRTEPEDRKEDKGPEYVIVVDGKCFADGLYCMDYGYNYMRLYNKDETLFVNVSFENGAAARVWSQEIIWHYGRTSKSHGKSTVQFLDDCSVMLRTDYEKLYGSGQQQDD